MNFINTRRAQIIASHWHGGQWSALYQFASSGIWSIENCLRYLQETERCLHPEYDLYPSDLSLKDERELTSLQNYFIREAKKNNIEIVWGKHSLYGYRIPFLHEDVPTEIEQKVQVLYYLK